MVKPQTQNIAISTITHSLLVDFVEKTDGKMGKIADRFLRERLEAELKKLPSPKKPS